MINTWNDVILHKHVPSEGRDDVASHLGVKFSKNPVLRD